MSHARRFAVLALLLSPVVPSAGIASAACSGDVIVSDFAYTPSAKTVPPGTTITWCWTGSNHSVTSTGNFDSHPACPPTCGNADATFSFTFTGGGPYSYHCKIHGGMQGTITVAQPSSAPPTTAPPTKSASPTARRTTPVPTATTRTPSPSTTPASTVAPTFPPSATVTAPVPPSPPESSPSATPTTASPTPFVELDRVARKPRPGLAIGLGLAVALAAFAGAGALWWRGRMREPHA